MKMLNCLFWGILTAFFVLIIEVIASEMVPQKPIFSSTFPSVSWFFAISIVIEEIAKFTAIFKLVSGENSKMAVISKSFFFGLGFSSFEITLNLFRADFAFSSSSTSFSLLGIFLFHILTVFYISYFITAFKFFRGIISTLVILFMIVLHFSYNLAIIHEISPLFIYFLILILVIIIIIRYLRANLLNTEKGL